MRLTESLRMGASECFRVGRDCCALAICASYVAPGCNPDGPASEGLVEAPEALPRGAVLLPAAAAPAVESTCIESGCLLAAAAACCAAGRFAKFILCSESRAAAARGTNGESGCVLHIP